MNSTKVLPQSNTQQQPQADSSKRAKSSKEKLFLNMLPPLTIYMAYQGYIVYNHTQRLNAEYGHCFTEESNHWTSFFGSFALYAVTMGPCTEWGATMFQKIIPYEKFPLGSKVRQDKAEFMADKAYRLMLYIIFTVCGFNLFKDTPYLHTNLLGTQ